ncbi:MAG: NfeD family protein [Oscillospiraceae bacterium]|nr:NfeD family protein [Oscillospiraceae bacterium]
MNFVIFWAVLLVAFIVIEIVTAGLTSIWFALGSAGALISAAVAPMPGLFWLQVIIFLLISGVTLYFTRPLAKKYIKVKESATNANRVLEMVGVVREPISNIDSKGAVYVGGKIWTARSENDAPIPEGVQVDILRIEGVKLIVREHVTEAKPAEEEK